MTDALPIKPGVKCLVQDSAGRFLLVKLSYAHKQWVVPGGGVDANESFEDAAKRELREETGVDLATMNFFAEYEGSRPGPHTVKCFHGITNSLELVAQPLEISEAGWFSVDELPADRSDRVDFVIGLFRQSQIV
jgi:ADP-ribose pyrophosphatase YjhB (NUDIX family)